MESAGPDTVELLRRWHAGDRSALDSLLERDLPWIRARVRLRLGPLLKAKAETEDLVQEALMDLLRYGPHFLLSSRAQFRALLSKIVENTLRDQHDRFTAYRRSARQERPLPPDSVLHLDPPRGSVPTPSRILEDKQWEAWIRLGLDLLDPDDRNVILLREWDGLSFAEVGERVGVSEDAARMRYRRALVRLSGSVQGLRSGRIADLLDGTEELDPEAAED